MVHLDALDKTRIVLLVVVCFAFVNFVVIGAAAAAPWYKVIDFESKSPSWQCAFSISRSAFYSWKQCSCDHLRIPDTALIPENWCEGGFYDWRNCENCDTLGCACSLELRIWNSTMGFVLLALACTGGVTFLLAAQIIEKFSSARSRSVHSIIHVLNFITLCFLISAFLLFLRLKSAIHEDFGNRCNSAFGVCDSFSGSEEGQQLKFDSFYYTYNQSWGPLMGFWTTLAAIIWTVVLQLSCVVYTFLLYRGPHSAYDIIK